MSLPVKVITFPKSSEMATVLGEKETRSIHEKRCRGTRLSLSPESFGLPRRQRICAGISRSLCKLFHRENL